MKFYQISDIGKIRKVNQDTSNIVINRNGEILLFVSDGIGGGNAGDVASGIIRDYMTENFLNKEFEPGYNHYNYLRNLISYTNVQVLSEARANPAYYGMGATLTGAIVNNSKTYFFNVGDSRCYTIKDDEMICRTTDHTLLASLIESGLINEDDVTNSNQRNVLLNAVGIETKLRIDIDSISNDYQYLLICSDGLYGYVNEEEIKKVIVSDLSVEDKCQKLVDMANENGGFDNCTVILLDRGEENE